MRYRELFGHLGFEVGIEIEKENVKVVAAPMLRYSPHVLLRTWSNRCCVGPL